MQYSIVKKNPENRFNLQKKSPENESDKSKKMPVSAAPVRVMEERTNGQMDTEKGSDDFLFFHTKYNATNASW